MISNLTLALSILLTIAGLAMAFSKKERERIQQRVLTELPERKAVTGSADALRVAQRRGYVTLGMGAALFIIWLVMSHP